jgi:flagellar basal body-associated protein FliL
MSEKLSANNIIVMVIGIILSGAMAWVATSINKQQDKTQQIELGMVRVEAKLEEMSRNIESAGADRYTSNEANFDWRTQEQKDTRQDSQITRALEWNQNLSNRLADIERSLRGDEE